MSVEQNQYNIASPYEANSDLIAICVLSLITLVIVNISILGVAFFRWIFGLVLIVFSPGYIFLAALFPGKKDLGVIERAALSVGLSVVLVGLIGLFLNYAGFGISLEPICVSITVFVGICSFIGYWRRMQLPRSESLSISFSHLSADVRSIFFASHDSRNEKIVGVVIIALILLSSTIIGYLILVPSGGEHFTEFYILSSQGKIGGYPTNLTVGQRQQYIIGISNHENMPTTYQMVVNLSGNASTTTLYKTNITLADGQTSQQNVSITPDHPGTNMKLDFLLLTDESTSPYREVYLWTNVTA
ncbi:MAG: DUF1616 domain-containing protein [Halobacteriota archaeon]